MYRRTQSQLFLPLGKLGNFFSSGGDGRDYPNRHDPMQNSPGKWWENARANLRGGENPLPQDVGAERNPNKPSEWASPFFSDPQARTFERSRQMKEDHEKRQQQNPNQQQGGWSPWDDPQYAQQMRNQQASDEQHFYNQQKYNDQNKRWGYDPAGSSNSSSSSHNQQPPDYHTYNQHQHQGNMPHSPNFGGGIPFGGQGGWSSHMMPRNNQQQGNNMNNNMNNNNPAANMMNSLARFGQMMKQNNNQQQQQSGGQQRDGWNNSNNSGGGGGGGNFGGGGGGGNNNPFGGMGGGGPGGMGGMFDKMLEWCSQSHAQDIARRMGINLQNIEFMTQADGSVKVKVEAPNATPQQIEELGKAVQEECPIARFRKTSMGEGNKAAEMEWVKALPPGSR